MDFDFSPKVKALREQLLNFMDEHIYPNEALFDQQVAEGDPWEPPAILASLKEKAQAAGLWNLFLPKEYLNGVIGNCINFARSIRLTISRFSTVYPMFFW